MHVHVYRVAEEFVVEQESIDLAWALALVKAGKVLRQTPMSCEFVAVDPKEAFDRDLAANDIKALKEHRDDLLAQGVKDTIAIAARCSEIIALKEQIIRLRAAQDTVSAEEATNG